MNPAKRTTEPRVFVNREGKISKMLSKPFSKVEKKILVENKPNQSIKPILIFLCILNLNLGFASGWFLWKNPALEQEDVLLVKAVVKTRPVEKTSFVKPFIGMKDFFVNFDNQGSHKLMKMNFFFELTNSKVSKEMEQLAPDIRSFILMIMAHVKYPEFSTQWGKREVLNHLKNRINLFLTKGKIKDVYFQSLTHIK